MVSTSHSWNAELVGVCWPCSMEAEMMRWHLHLKREEKMHWSYLLLSENPRQAQADRLKWTAGFQCSLPIPLLGLKELL